MESYKLQELKWTDVAAYLKKDDRIIIPIGSIEQHGPWLPLGTDSFSAIGLAEDAGKETGVIVAPPIWYGWSSHHMAFPGTVNVRPEVLINYLFDIIKSLSTHGFKKFILINGHRVMNMIWMQISADKAQSELNVKIVIFDPAYMSKEIVEQLGFGPLGHAEEIEGSHTLFKYPHLVDVSKANQNEIVEEELYHPDPRDMRDTLIYIPSTKEDRKYHGTMGSDERANLISKEKGEKYHKHLLKRLIQVTNNLKK